MLSKDSTTTARDAELHDYWIQTVMDDRAETAGPPPMPVPADATDDEEVRDENQ